MSDPYDLAVIGGGINGCGIAREAAMRGAKVVLFERGDLARGTSSASTKLIHGGLRYLEHFEFRLVRESLVERERLWAIAPHIISPMRFVLPHMAGNRPRWLIRLALFVYDHIGGRKYLPQARSIDLRSEPTGIPLLPSYTYGFEYSDCWVDDARLVVLNALDAAAYGASINTHSEVIKLARENGVWTISTSDNFVIKAHAVVNAAGPSVLELNSRTEEPHSGNQKHVRLVRGSHIVVAKMFDTPQAYFCQNRDGRIFFAIPYEDDFTLIGTTDADHYGSLDDVKATDDEIAYLCASAGAYFKQALVPTDVVYSYAGVRPLVDDGTGKPESASRGYHFEIDADASGNAPILSVYGGKITTYRHLADRAVNKLSAYLSILSGKSTTDASPLPGGDFPINGRSALQRSLAREYPFLDPKLLTRLVRNYGTRARLLLGEARSLNDLGFHFGFGLYQSEVDYLMINEWASCADDIVLRRTKIGLRMSVAEQIRLNDYMLAKVRHPGNLTNRATGMSSSCPAAVETSPADRIARP